LGTIGNRMCVILCMLHTSTLSKQLFLSAAFVLCIIIFFELQMTIEKMCVVRLVVYTDVTQTRTFTRIQNHHEPEQYYTIYMAVYSYIITLLSL